MPNSIALLLMLLLAAQLIVSAESACPNGMTNVTHAGLSWCIKYYDKSATFCEAVKTCHENGQEMISKNVHDAMQDISIPGDNRWWVGVVDALNERNTHDDGWVWIKDGQVTQSGDFHSGEPNNGPNQDCVTIEDPSQKRLRDETCDHHNSIYCYADEAVANRIYMNLNSGEFEQVEITERQQPDPGCWIKEPSAKTDIDCTRTCLQFQFGDCIGFYWHPVRRQCVLLPFFDASVPLNRPEFSANELEKMQWTKYIRRNG